MGTLVLVKICPKKDLSGGNNFYKTVQLYFQDVFIVTFLYNLFN